MCERFGEDKLCASKLCDDKLCVDKLCVDKLCVSNLCDDKLCVSKLCDDKLWTSCVWTSCGREGREAEEEAAAGYRTKNKNPTQRCGEKMLSQILPRQLPTCPSRNKVDFCQNKPYF